VQKVRVLIFQIIRENHAWQASNFLRFSVTLICFAQIAIPQSFAYPGSDCGISVSLRC
jgi:hypothetical protein